MVPVQFEVGRRGAGCVLSFYFYFYFYSDEQNK